MSSRELRVIDTSVLAGLQQGTAFFASTTVFAIGGSFALLNSSAQVIAVSSSLPVSIRLRARFSKPRQPCSC